MDSGYLNAELIKAEKKRLEIFIGVLTTITVISVVVMNAFPGVLRATFTNPFSFPTIIISGVTMSLLFIVARRWVIKVEQAGRRLPRKYFWYMVFIEVTIPSAWLVVTSEIEETSALLDSPIIFVYFLLIIVSSLHLDVWISTVMGLLIAVFIVGFTYWVTNKYPMEFGLPLIIYYIRAVLYFLSGLCAGLVALELKRRLAITYDHIQEKEKIEGLFNQQVSREVVDALKEKTDFAARMDVSILFLDIRDFTNRVQHLEPEEVNRFQNEFFSPVIEIVNGQKGIVNQIMGDGLMATFGAPISDDRHHLLAWNAVKEILEFLKKYQDDHGSERKLDVGIGLHCGQVLVGNIGTTLRKQFSISGTPVIIASRIEQLNKEFNSTLLMSKPIFDRLSAEIDNYEELGNVRMKGLDEELEIIKIL
jgi:adenylate cyclase